MEWLGEVPEEWEVVRLKFIASVQTGVAKGKDNTGKRVVEVPYLRVANVQDGYFDLSDIATIEIPDDELNRYALRAGDVLMNEGGDYDKLGRGHVWNGEISPCIHQNHVFAVRPTGVSSDWLNRITGSNYAQYYFVARSKQSTNLASISSTNIMELTVVLPPVEEQETIADFLDRETAKIDALIAEQERLIALLAEKRQGVISHAVTKGLDPTVPMKDSGVEWLGEVPEHWRCIPARRLFRFSKRQGYTELTVLSIYRDYGVIEKDSRDDNFNKTPENLDLYQLVEPGDLVINKMKAWQGSLGVSSLQGITSPDYIVYVSIHNENNNYVHFMLRQRNMAGVYKSISNGIRPQQWRLEAEKFEGLLFFIPPRAEQEEIVTFLVDHVERIDALTTEASHAIDLLRERRSALISAAVTGKIDVRAFAQEAAA
jgi:type I restriction enzyme S subunit